MQVHDAVGFTVQTPLVLTDMDYAPYATTTNSGTVEVMVQLSLAATGGVHSAEDAVKMILAGADVVDLCSTLLQHGPRQLAHILEGMERWLDESPYESLEQCKGVMSQQQSSDPGAFERANYVSLLGGYTVSTTHWR